MIKLGIDIGSRNTKIVLWDSIAGQIVYAAWRSTDVHPLDTVNDLLGRAYRELGITLVDQTGCTGYGRKLYPSATRTISEIACHAAGVRFFHSDCRTIIDIGGQDSKIISLESEGRVRDFVMNDKCAAGTGRFLEMISLRLNCPLEQLSALAGRSDAELAISSTCVVFAESEIISLIAQNHKPADIARAVHQSIARRVLAQISALDHQPPVSFTGGVALISDLVHCLEQELGCPVQVPPEPELTGALGAALLV